MFENVLWVCSPEITVFQQVSFYDLSFCFYHITSAHLVRGLFPFICILRRPECWSKGYFLVVYLHRIVLTRHIGIHSLHPAWDHFARQWTGLQRRFLVSSGICLKAEVNLFYNYMCLSVWLLFNLLFGCVWLLKSSFVLWILWVLVEKCFLIFSFSSFVQIIWKVAVICFHNCKCSLIRLGP